MEDHGFAQADQAVKPAGWPKPIGIISLILGIMSVTCGVIGIGFTFASGGFFGSMMSGQLPPNTPPPPFVPPMNAIFIASIVVSLLLNAILIAAAVKLLARSASGRSLHLLYAIVGVVSAFFGSFAGYQGQQALGAQQLAWAEQYGDGNDMTKQMADQFRQQQQMRGPIQAVGIVIGLLVRLAWPLFCVIWFGMVKKSVPPAFEF